MRAVVVALTLASGCTVMTDRVGRFVTDLRVTRDGLQVERCEVVHRIELKWSYELLPVLGAMLGALCHCRMQTHSTLNGDWLNYTTYYVCSFQKEDCRISRYRFCPAFRPGEAS